MLRTVHLNWDEIVEVSFVKHKSAILIQTAGGKSRRVFIYLDGLGTLRDCLDHFAPYVLDESARVMLPGTALDLSS
ncbi:MAG TPA: hypothetical protein VGG61_14105 [Gemmataceae bacterium]